MSDIHDIPSTLLEGAFSDEDLVDDAMSSFVPKPIISRDLIKEETDKEREVPATTTTLSPHVTKTEVEADKRPWRKPDEKPKRPLSAYNLFFQLERQRLISDSIDTSPYTAEDVANISIAHKMKKEKRRHRKTHGKISFADLARTIAQKWKALQAADKVVFEERAEIEKARYKEDLEEWNIKQQQSFNQRKANMLRKVSLEPNPGMAGHLDSSSRMGMHGGYPGSLSHQRGSYDLGMYGGHDASLHEEASLQQSLMQRQSLARYQALMEQQLDQASLDQMVLGYPGGSHPGARGSGLSSHHPYLSGAGSQTMSPGGYRGSSYYGEDDYDYKYGTPTSGMGRSSASQAHARGQMMNNRHGDAGLRDMSSRSHPSHMSDPYFSSMDQSSSSAHGEIANGASAYHQQTAGPQSNAAPVDNALTLDPHQGMSSPVLETEDGTRMDPFGSMHVI